MIDVTLKLEDGTAEKTSSGYGEVDSSAQVIDLGDGLIRGNVIIDVSALAMADNDELYKIVLLGGSDESFTTEVSLCALELGVREEIEDSLDSKLGRYTMAFQNEKAGVIYPYVRIRHVISGSTPSINYVARLEKDLPVMGMISTATTTTTTV